MNPTFKKDKEINGPTKRSFGIPKRSKKKKKKFEWISDVGTSTLVKKLPIQEDKTFYFFTGVPVETAEFLSADVIAGTMAAKKFVEFIEQNFRNLTTNMIEKEVRSMGELHGPVKWSETLSWRSTSFGAEHFYVSKSQVRSYNCPENRVLVAALDKITKSVPKQFRETRKEIEAIAVANKADLILNHHHLKSVPILSQDKLSFDKKRTRMARNASLYFSALEILEMSDFQQAEKLPATNDMLYFACDNQTKVIHRLVAELNKCLEDLEIQSKDLQVETKENYLQLGEIKFRGGNKNGYVLWNQTILTVHNHIGTSVEASDKKIVAIDHPDDLLRFVETTLRSSIRKQNYF